MFGELLVGANVGSASAGTDLRRSVATPGCPNRNPRGTGTLRRRCSVRRFRRIDVLARPDVAAFNRHRWMRGEIVARPDIAMSGFDHPGPVPAAQQHRVAGNAVDMPPEPARRVLLPVCRLPRRPGERPAASPREGRRASPAPRRSRGRCGLPSLNRMVASASNPMRRLEPIPSACPGLSTKSTPAGSSRATSSPTCPHHHQPGSAADEHVECPAHPGPGTGVHQRLRPAVPPAGPGRQDKSGDRRAGRLLRCRTAQRLMIVCGCTYGTDGSGNSMSP